MTRTNSPILGRIGRMLTLGSMKRLKSPCSLSVKMSAITESICCSILSLYCFQGLNPWCDRDATIAGFTDESLLQVANAVVEQLTIISIITLNIITIISIFTIITLNIIITFSFQCNFLSTSPPPPPNLILMLISAPFEKTLHLMLSRVTRPQMKYTNEDKLSRKVS